MIAAMNRRAFIALLGGAAAAWPLAARAQQPEKNVRVGVLGTLPLPPVQRFFRKLQEYGYIEGRNLRLEARFAEGRDDRYPALAAELVALPVDIIVTWGTPAALAAKQATTTIPIVMVIADPVSVGIISLAECRSRSEAARAAQGPASSPRPRRRSGQRRQSISRRRVEEASPHGGAAARRSRAG